MRLRQNGRHFPDDSFKRRIKIKEFRSKLHFMFLRVQLTRFRHCLRWCLRTEKATSHYLDQWWISFLTHKCVTGPQIVNVNVYCRCPDCHLAPSHQQPKRLLKLPLCLEPHILLCCTWIFYVTLVKANWVSNKHKRNHEMILRSKRLSRVLIPFWLCHWSVKTWELTSNSAVATKNTSDPHDKENMIKRTPVTRIIGRLLGKTCPITCGMKLFIHSRT